ncbi:MAG: transketolase [Bacilli bacterium]|nr:transketolase [Bacilli bacterium]
MFIIGKEEKNYEIDEKGVNNLRGLALDMIVNAGSGHGGIILSSAPIVYTLFKYHMNIDINNLDFVNRDRFVFSAGHGVPLLYGIDYFLDLLTLDDLKSLRKINSKTPGHPEFGTPLVDFSSGALGQGIATSVGYAIASKYLDKKTNNLVDYYTYVLCGDGELEEGITYESLALAGTLNLNNLIVLVDLNEVTLDNKLNVSSSEDLKKRFESIDFNVIECDDSVKNINESIETAKNKNDKPTVIFIKTKIGLYSKYEGTNKAHGMVPDAEDLKNIKEKLGLFESSFTVNASVVSEFKEEVLERGKNKVLEFEEKYQKLENKDLIDKIIQNKNTYSLGNLDIEYDRKSLRELSGELLNIIANDFDLLIGGSADLSSSCKTNLKEFDTFSSSNYLGRNIYFGIREHASAAIINGMALAGLRPFTSTFLVFSDYMRTGIRESALMNLPVLYIFTHDSITVGRDGPLHQPIEQLTSLELIPNLKVYRPFDLNELIGCYKEIFEHKNPSCLILPRESKEISEYTKSSGVVDGIYEVIPNDTDNFINLIANGEELGIVLKVSKNLKEIGVDNKVFSIPCKKNIKINTNELFMGRKTIGITLGSPNYFFNITNDVIGMNEFGKSGSNTELLEEFGFTEEKLVNQILELLKK